MDKTLVEALKPLVANPAWEDIKTFVEWRKGSLIKTLLQTQTFDEVNKIKGAIAELDYLLLLKDRVFSAEKGLMHK